MSYDSKAADITGSVWLCKTRLTCAVAESRNMMDLSKYLDGGAVGASFLACKGADQIFASPKRATSQSFAGSIFKTGLPPRLSVNVSESNSALPDLMCSRCVPGLTRYSVLPSMTLIAPLRNVTSTSSVRISTFTSASPSRNQRITPSSTVAKVSAMAAIRPLAFP